jgi:NADPH:quinone reductase-like Zn-dependent oxidoreductase
MKKSIPTTMRAAAVEQFGGPDVLVIRELSVPIPNPTEVLIEVDTAGVGSWDAEMREGWSPSGESHFPLVLGTDGSGTIAATGSSVSGWEVGDRVYSYSFDNPKGGFYAEYVAVVSERVAHLPRSLDFEHAGAIPTTGLTAMQGIDEVLRVKPGQSIIVLGASGGVGTLAVSIAKFRGARVLAIASGNDGVALARRLGADEAVEGHHGDVLAAARQFAKEGVDGVLVLAGGNALMHCLEVVRQGGRVAYPNGVEPEPKKRDDIEIRSYDAASNRHELGRLARLVDECKPEIVIAASCPLGQAAKAHEQLARGHVLGKIVLRTHPR